MSVAQLQNSSLNTNSSPVSPSACIISVSGTEGGTNATTYFVNGQPGSLQSIGDLNLTIPYLTTNPALANCLLIITISGVAYTDNAVSDGLTVYLNANDETSNNKFYEYVIPPTVDWPSGGNTILSVRSCPFSFTSSFFLSGTRVVDYTFTCGATYTGTQGAIWKVGYTSHIAIANP